MAELADALDSGSSLCKEVQVQVLLPAPSEALKTLRFRGFSLSKFVGRHVTSAHKLMLRVCLCFTLLFYEARSHTLIHRIVSVWDKINVRAELRFHLYLNSQFSVHFSYKDFLY